MHAVQSVLGSSLDIHSGLCFVAISLTNNAQAVSKDGKSSDHLIITVRVLESSLGSLSTLEVLKSSGLASDSGLLSSAGRTGRQQRDSCADGGGSSSSEVTAAAVVV